MFQFEVRFGVGCQPLAQMHTMRIVCNEERSQNHLRTRYWGALNQQKLIEDCLEQEEGLPLQRRSRAVGFTGPLCGLLRAEKRLLGRVAYLSMKAQLGLSILATPDFDD